VTAQLKLRATGCGASALRVTAPLKLRTPGLRAANTVFWKFSNFLLRRLSFLGYTFGAMPEPLTLPAWREHALPRASWLGLSSHWLRRLRWIAICWIVVFWRLGYSSLLDPDEAHYAELTREMLHSGSWLVPLLDGKPFIDKPVLFHWLQGASVALLGESEFSARLPSALAALVVFATTRWLGASLFGAEVGEWGAIMFATVPATFALASIALFDMVFAAFLFGGLACLLVAAKEHRPRLEYPAYGLITLAVMTKGPIALVLLLLFILTAALSGADLRARLGALRWRSGLTFVVLAASPWFVWMEGRFGTEFVEKYLLAGNLWYLTQPTSFSARAISHTFYARVFASGFFPWSAVLIGRGVDALRSTRWRIRMTADEKLLWIWTVVVVGFFSVARFKLDHYIFPAAPTCCLLAAHAWRRSVDTPDRTTVATRFSVLAIAGLLIVGGSFSSVYLFTLDLELPSSAIVLPLALVVGGIALMTQSALGGWKTPRTPAVLVITLLASYMVIASVGFPVLEHTRPTALVARRLRHLTGGHAPTALYRLERWRASLRYYLDRPIDRLENPEEVKLYLSRPEPVYVVMLRREYDALRRDGTPIYLVMQHRAVVGTTGVGLRRQLWGFLVVATNAPSERRTGF
jgi:4-amino-4-deoxy-L-arabinose transferase-like glycosyltransferase